MDKLEQYLDQVCRSLGGSRAMRQHVRQELAEHLRDAVAEYRAAGMSEPEALARALADFGGPEQVRSELEATHGQRLMAVVIDKAIEWKEKTMKAKWLWASWAHLALALVIALELLLITFNVIFIIPKFQKLTQDGIIDPAIIEEQGLGWMSDCLGDLSYVGGHYTTWLLLAAVVLIGLFEWRVKSENKSFIRLAGLGTVAVGLMVVILFMSAALVISFTIGVPAVGRMVRPWAVQQVSAIDASVAALQAAQAKKDWPVVQEQADLATQAMDRLSAGPAVISLTNDGPKRQQLRATAGNARQNLAEVQRAVRDHDEERLGRDLRIFEQSFVPLREAAKTSEHPR